MKTCALVELIASKSSACPPLLLTPVDWMTPPLTTVMVPDVTSLLMRIASFTAVIDAPDALLTVRLPLPENEPVSIPRVVPLIVPELLTVARSEGDEPPFHVTAVAVTIEPPFRTLRVSLLMIEIAAVVVELMVVIDICDP